MTELTPSFRINVLYPEYAIYEDGTVYKWTTNTIIKTTQNKNGVLMIKLVNSEKVRRTIQLHRLLAQTYFPTTDSTLVVNHIDGNKRNNDLSNLEWISQGKNVEHTGLIGKGRYIIVQRIDPTNNMTLDFPNLAEVIRCHQGTVSGYYEAFRIPTKMYKGFFWKQSRSPEQPVGVTTPIFINGTATEYLVSNTGIVYNSRRSLKPNAVCGYYQTSLQIGGKRVTIATHRLVAIAFLPNPQNLEIVHHKDHDTFNNHVENLEWTTRSMNAKYANAHYNKV